MPCLTELVELLALERIEADRFRGGSQDLGWGLVFGGQVVGQALSAAAHTVPADRPVHSLHAYFLRPGDPRRPVDYAVERLRDGRAFATRTVLAAQDGRPICHLSASFQVAEASLEHADPMPAVPGPDGLASDRELWERRADRVPPAYRARVTAERPIELRPTDPVDLFEPERRPAEHAVWLRAAGALPDDPAVHRLLLAYASDFAFVSTALRPHATTFFDRRLQVASLDHAMWFHRPFRADDWLLHAMRSPTAAGARGLVQGRIFSRDGRLVASTAQEGLFRWRP